MEEISSPNKSPIKKKVDDIETENLDEQYTKTPNVVKLETGKVLNLSRRYKDSFKSQLG